MTLYSDSKQNLNLNLGIAPPSNSEGQMVNIHHNGSGLQVQHSWDGIPVDKSAMVRLRNVVCLSGVQFFLKSAICF